MNKSTPSEQAQNIYLYCPEYTEEICNATEEQLDDLELVLENADLERDRAGWDNTTDKAHQSVINAYVGGYFNTIHV